MRLPWHGPAALPNRRTGRCPVFPKAGRGSVRAAVLDQFGRFFPVKDLQCRRFAFVLHPQGCTTARTVQPAAIYQLPPGALCIMRGKEGPTAGSLVREVQMKVIGFVGSPRKKGNTDLLVDTFLAGAQAGGAQTRKWDSG